ncbi:HK97 family phage prohead protease [Qipengyuania spongiae]|uniref:HK97 family phage prohead protease n=1 Tax=Qipengyuania spongiae TaxID=2909673 RepID=A0ABY5SYJ7_9SPHN|nr:HK97 family phage prohead protease [Qipengyuania spongiae]UVI39245.1 HK97 family phage prohead protease [Qipengyuania spongiae]
MDYVGSPLEIKELSESGSIEGLLAGFGNTDSHGDVIDTKAFSRTLAERGGNPLPMLLHHDPKRPIGAWNEWQEKSEGLYVKGRLTMAARDAQEAYALAKDGALPSLSVGYVARKANVDQRTGERHLLDVDLIEGSLVVAGSNPLSRVSSVKSISTAGDIADLLREAGVSGRKAKAAAGFAWKAINDTDADEDEVRAILNASAARIAAIGDRK